MMQCTVHVHHHTCLCGFEIPIAWTICMRFWILDRSIWQKWLKHPQTRNECLPRHIKCYTVCVSVSCVCGGELCPINLLNWNNLKCSLSVRLVQKINIIGFQIAVALECLWLAMYSRTFQNRGHSLNRLEMFDPRAFQWGDFLCDKFFRMCVRAYLTVNSMLIHLLIVMRTWKVKEKIAC